jgi:MFS family permease
MSHTQAIAPRYGNLVAAIATIACCDIATGLMLQLLPLLMNREGLPAWVIGLNTAMGPIGILVGGPFFPRVIGNIGTKRAAYIMIAAMIISMLALKLAPSVWWWFPLRFFFGVSTSALFTISETWVLTFSDDGNRGRIMALFTSALAITFSVGPLILPWTGIDGWWPWTIAMVCVGLASLPLLFVQVDGAAFKQEHGSGGVFAFARKAPMLLFAVSAATLFDNVFISFFTIFGLRHGIELDVASRILGVGIIGNVLMFYPIGWLADHWSKRGVIVLTAALAVVLSLSLIVLINHWLIWGAVILLTSAAFGVYVVALAVMGDSFKGPDLIAGAAAMAAMWGIGGLIGPPVAGTAIDLFGINAMPVTLAVFYAILLAGLALSRGKLVRDDVGGDVHG